MRRSGQGAPARDDYVAAGWVGNTRGRPPVVRGRPGGERSRTLAYRGLAYTGGLTEVPRTDGAGATLVASRLVPLRHEAHPRDPVGGDGITRAMSKCRARSAGASLPVPPRCLGIGAVARYPLPHPSDPAEDTWRCEKLGVHGPPPTPLSKRRKKKREEEIQGRQGRKVTWYHSKPRPTETARRLYPSLSALPL